MKQRNNNFVAQTSQKMPFFARKENPITLPKKLQNVCFGCRNYFRELNENVILLPKSFCTFQKM